MCKRRRAAGLGSAKRLYKSAKPETQNDICNLQQLNTLSTSIQLRNE